MLHISTCNFSRMHFRPEMRLFTSLTTALLDYYIEGNKRGTTPPHFLLVFEVGEREETNGQMERANALEPTTARERWISKLDE